jgi:3-oxoacyl-[acyl-carrier protein] reductase
MRNGQPAEQPRQVVDAPLALARRLDRSAAGALAGLLERVADLPADDRRAPDGVAGLVERALDRPAGLLHAVADRGQLLDGVVDHRAEPGEQQDGQDEGDVGGDGGGAAPGQVGIELHGRRVPRRSPNEPQELCMGVLDDKVAIVTGSARGIGRATAELLASQGAKVLINDLDKDVAEQAAGEIQGETTVFGGDLTKDGVPDQLVQAAVDAWGRIDIIVNNAGYTLDAPIHKMSDDWFQRMLDIHLIAPFRIIRAAAPHLREPAKQEKAEGQEVFRKIVNVSSVSGTMGNAGQANYSAGKNGIVGLTKTLAKEWGQFKVNCNAVAFGFIETRLTAAKEGDNTMEVDGEKVQLGIPEQMRGMASMLIPLGRPGTPEEAAGGVFFLCSPWSNYVHGQVLNVTGGQFTGMTT